jgi:hypothetical protein
LQDAKEGRLTFRDWPIGSTAGFCDLAKPVVLYVVANGTCTVTVQDGYGKANDDEVYWVGADPVGESEDPATPVIATVDPVSGEIRLPPEFGVVGVTPEMFGAKGDGVSDDSDALEDAIAAWLADRTETSNQYWESIGRLVLNGRYKISRTLSVVPPANITGGEICGVGTVVGNGALALSFRGDNYMWQGLTVRDVCFDEAPIEIHQAGGDATSIFGVLFDNIRVWSSNTMTLPAINWIGVFESRMQNCTVSWVSETASCVKIQNAQSCVASSISIDHLVTRGGLHGLECRDYWQGLSVGGQSVFLTAAAEGAYLESAGASVTGCHFEQNCRVSGDSGLHLVGSGVLTALDGNQQANSLQKYLIRTYAATSPVVIVGGHAYNTIPDAKIVYVGGASPGVSVKLIGVSSKDINAEMADQVVEL